MIQTQMQPQMQQLQPPQPPPPIPSQQPQLIQAISPQYQPIAMHIQNPYQPLPLPPQQSQGQEIVQLWNRISTVRLFHKLIATPDQDYPGNNAKLHSGPNCYKSVDELVAHINAVVETSMKEAGALTAMVAGDLKKKLEDFQEERKKGVGLQQNPQIQFRDQNPFNGAAISPQIRQSFPVTYNNFPPSTTTPQMTSTPGIEPQVNIIIIIVLLI